MESQQKQVWKCNKIKYVKNYNSNHYKQLKINLKIDEYKKLEKYCIENKKSKAQLIRDIINKL